MRIGIDISQIQYQHTGVARFTEGLIHAIFQHGEMHQWLLYYHGHGKKLNTFFSIKLPQHIHVIERMIPERIENMMFNRWHHISSPLAKRWYSDAESLDWFITSDWIEPPLDCKKATVIHDLAFKKYPETVDPYIRTTQEYRLAHATKECSIIFADSNSTKQDIQKYYPNTTSFIKVNHLGMDQQILPDVEGYIETINRNNTPYILSVGKQEPRKNYQRLINAWKPFSNKISLIIVGQKGWGHEIKVDDSRLHIVEKANEHELATLYRNAYMFVFPSLYEGFGYPLLEAMKYGCPVIASGNSSLSEIGGDAMLPCDPLDVQSISACIKKLITHNTLREELILKGKRHAQMFTWKRYYNTLISVLSTYETNDDRS